MKKILTLLICVFTVGNTIAQMKSIINCGTDDVHLKAMKEDSAYKLSFEENNKQWVEWATKRQTRKNDTSARSVPLTAPVTLTVVFHDMVSPNNIKVTTEAAGYQYIIDGLNTTFVGSNINFCLAQKKANGDTYTYSQSIPTTAISALDRFDLATRDAIIDLCGTAVNFPTTKYINVYVLDTLTNGKAFASLPMSHGTPRDGIFMERSLLINGPEFAQIIKTFAHEMGHYLGLYHTFGVCETSLLPLSTPAEIFACSCENAFPLNNGDMVADTPPCMLPNDSYICGTVVNTCLADTYNDDKTNYMDYSNRECQDHFSAGQIERMQFIVDPELGKRRSLIGGNACVNCSALNSCTFAIIPVPNNSISQDSATSNPAISLSTTTTCAAPATTLVY